MAIAVTPVINKKNYKSWTVTALDADTTFTFAHGFTTPLGVGFAPDMVCMNSTLSQGTTGTSTWGVTVDAVNITLDKQPEIGSGGLTPGVTVLGKLVAWKPHSVAE